MTAEARKHVFLLDDSAFTLELTSAALAGAGIEVTCGRDLADVTRHLGDRFDLILLDVEMPEVFGDDVATWLGDEGNRTPVYLVSGLPEDQLAERARECGARGYISKRAGIAAVVAEVVRILEGAGAPPPFEEPEPLIESFLTMAQGRLARARAAVERGDPAMAGYELNTLAGEAALLGLHELAERAAGGHVAVTVSVMDSRDVHSHDTVLGAIETDLVGTAHRAHIPIARPHQVRDARILLLDDSDLYRSTLMRVLERAGYQVVEARRLAEARHRMHEGHFGLVILDLQLDDGRGGELVRELKQHPGHPRLLVLYSGKRRPVMTADALLPKTTPPAELFAKIAELLDRH